MITAKSTFNVMSPEDLGGQLSPKPVVVGGDAVRGLTAAGRARASAAIRGTRSRADPTSPLSSGSA